MSKKPTPPINLPQDDPEQSKRFIDMAREVEADEDPEAFDRVFKELTRKKPDKPDKTPQT